MKNFPVIIIIDFTGKFLCMIKETNLKINKAKRRITS